MNPIDPFYRLFQILVLYLFSVLCRCHAVSVIVTCCEVWTLGVWGELACHKRLFNPPPQFSRLGTWCPAFVCMYVYVCACVCVCVCCLVFIFGWRVCVWRVGGWGEGGGGGYGLFLVFLFFIASMLYTYVFDIPT